ncbi:hypothetical protein MKX08_007232 [Trichoderma sp. CBMAI-0020]|nr:hypothetical protein MKX08_007232 [Trichoderma sp. CBMAI-0020]
MDYFNKKEEYQEPSTNPSNPASLRNISTAKPTRGTTPYSTRYSAYNSPYNTNK